uniref:Reverse transcriptase domain-containing protein n=1 Tax=Tanacetum cinerariifolium TaxID=118510 RepID=A0A6L2JN42_TANCI|nr:reverse transcriptase domain-containing protein [Tanacetum cinerariifolium]
MEYLVKISKNARILELKQRYFEDYCFDIQYAVSIKEDTAYLCLHSPKTMKGTRSIRHFLEDLFPNQPSGNPTFSLHPELTSPEVNNDIFDSEGFNVLSEKFLDLDSTKDLYPPLHDNPLSGSTTYPLLEGLKNSIDQKNHAHLADIFVDSIPAMFIDEHTLDYSSPLIFDVYADDFLEVYSDVENIYNDPFDSKGEKIKESKLLIDELDLPYDFHPPPEYDSFISQDFSKQTNAVTTAMTAILKQFQANPPPAPVKAVEETCVTYESAHPYYQCLAAGGNTFLEFRDNILGYVSAVVVNYNQGNPGYRPPGSTSLPSNTVANPKGELKAITTRSGLVIDGPTVPTPSRSINPEEDERVEETFTDLDLAEYTIKVPPPPAKKYKPPSQREFVVHQRDPPNRAICTPAGIARDVFIPVGKFTFLADFVIVDYESDPRVPLILGRPFLRTARALIDVYGEEMIIYDGDERLTLNMRHDTSSYSNQHQKESINLINFDIESDLKEIEFLLYQDKDSSLKDSIDQKNRAHLADIFVDSIPMIFTDEHTLDYSSPSIFDVYVDDFLEVEFDAENIYNDPFDSKGEKIKESKLLIDELDLLCDFHLPPEYDLFISHDFSKVDVLPSTNNEDKIFNPGILIQEKPVEIITRVVQDKKLEISNASLVFEDFDPPFYEPLFFKEVPTSNMLLLFSENEEKLFKPGIHTSEKVHSYFIPELSHQGYKVFKINQIFKSLMKIFLFYCGKDTHILAVPLHHFYPLDQFKYGGVRSSSVT